MDMRRQLAFYFCMKSYLVTHMDEVGLLWLYLFYKSQSLLKSLMGIVVLMTQCIDHKKINIFKKTGGFIGKSAHIGDVSHASHAVSEDGHFSVYHGERFYHYITNLKGLAGNDLIHHQFWHAGIELSCETVW